MNSDRIVSGNTEVYLFTTSLGLQNKGIQMAGMAHVLETFEVSHKLQKLQTVFQHSNSKKGQRVCRLKKALSSLSFPPIPPSLHAHMYSPFSFFKCQNSKNFCPMLSLHAHTQLEYSSLVSHESQVNPHSSLFSELQHHTGAIFYFCTVLKISNFKKSHRRAFNILVPLTD